MGTPQNKYVVAEYSGYSVFLTTHESDVVKLQELGADPAFFLRQPLIDQEGIHGNFDIHVVIIRPNLREKPLDFFQDYDVASQENPFRAVGSNLKEFRSDLLKEKSFSSDQVGYFAFQESLGKSYLNTVEEIVLLEELHNAAPSTVVANAQKAHARLNKLDSHLQSHITNKRDEYPEVSYRAKTTLENAVNFVRSESRNPKPHFGNIAYALAQIGAHGVLESEPMGTELYLLSKNTDDNFAQYLSTNTDY